MVRVRARVRSSFGKRRQLPEWFSRARPRSHAVPQLPTGGAAKSALGLAARERNPSGALSVAHGLFTRLPTAFLEMGEPFRKRSPQHSVSTKGLAPCASPPVGPFSLETALEYEF